MDFFRVCTRESRKKGGPIEVYADYTVGRSRDLMIQGGAFYAIWDEKKGLWSRDEYDVAILVDQKIREKVEELEAAGTVCDPKYLTSFDNGRWEKFKKFVRSVSDNSHPMDNKVAFADTEVKRSDYGSRKLPYSMAAGSIAAYEELVSLLYEPEEREKFEWVIGAIISGDAKKLQKFLVFYGSGGTGKSTILELISKIFGGKIGDGGYVSYFDAQALTGNGNSFAVASFKDNPLVAIQHDGDLSKIETNARLNSIVSHEEIDVNEKFKAQYTKRINAFLLMGTNKPVQITDARSGLIRRLIDVNPTGNIHTKDRYDVLIQRLDFELGAIAHHCLQVYKKLGKNYYNGYIPEKMMMKTDVFRNYVEEHFDIFKQYDGVTLKQAWELYKAYCDMIEVPFRLTMIKFREELKNYFDEFQLRGVLNGVQVHKVYLGFNAKQFRAPVENPKSNEKTFSLVLDETVSLFDEMYAGVPAQYGNEEGTPAKFWDDSERLDKNGNLYKPKKSQIATTVLGDLITTKLHFVNLPEYHIVIDFDLTDDEGNKSLERSLEAASSWPPTYAEISKGGNGVHLHYIYDGDTDELANEYSPGIEIKVYRGNGSLRRKLTKCNNIAVATISSGLPFREKKMLAPNALKSEQGLRTMIIRNMRKEYHAGTKPSVDFIAHLLDEAYRSGLVYDVSDMRQDITLFANGSRNQAQAAIKTVNRMKFKSEITADEVDQKFEQIVDNEGGRLVFFDCEVYPNLFVVCWKYQGSEQIVRMINPSPSEIENLLKMRLVGFNNRGYDNHILWARTLHASNKDLYELSQRLISNDEKAKYGAAWAASYADVYDFSTDKKGLKKWEIELGLKHVEMDIPWDQPVPPEKVDQVVEYCCNDVVALEAVFEHCKGDFAARQILADMSGLSVNNSTRQHVMRILFGNEQKDAKKKFVYTDLSELFPGYTFDKYSKTEKSKYRGEVVGEGGYVYAEPGMYENVAVLDIASMHPTSIEELNLFGEYTERFNRLKEARLAIKHGNFLQAEALLPNVDVDETNAKALSNALKLVLNSTYGYTCAKFDNPARDPRNIDNIVAKRGALFMVDLKNAVQEQGFTVAHIKTDSIKIPNATPDIIAFVQEFGAQYGYTFEHEATYKKMCLVNDAVLVAYVGWNADDKPEHWKAVGAEFQHPFVFKTLFTDEAITFKDLCETKQVKEGAMYLRFPKTEKNFDLDVIVNGDEEPSLDYYDVHIGRSGMFVAINPDQVIFQGGTLLRIKDGKEYAVTGTKGYLWAESEMIRVIQAGAIERMRWENVHDAIEGTGSIADVIDMAYYLQLAEDAAQSIEKFGDFEWFVDKVVFKEKVSV